MEKDTGGKKRKERKKEKTIKRGAKYRGSWWMDGWMKRAKVKKVWVG